MAGLGGTGSSTPRAQSPGAKMTREQAQQVLSQWIATRQSKSATQGSPSAQSTTQSQESPGMDAGDYLGLAKTGVSLAGQAGKLFDVPGAGYTGAVTAPLGLGAGIANEDPAQMIQGGYNTAMEGVKLADKMGWLTPATSAAEGAAGGVAGAGAGVAGGLWGGAGGAGTAMLPGAGSAMLTGSGGMGTTLVGTGATGGAMGAESAGLLAGALNPLTIAATVFLAIGLNNWQQKKADRIKNQTVESNKMRMGAKEGLDTLRETSSLTPILENIDPQFMPEVLDKYREGLAEWPVVQQTIGSKGQGGRASKTKPLPDHTVDAMTNVFYPDLRETQAGYLWAADAAARSGQDMPDWMDSFGQSDPAALMNNLSRGFGGDQDLGIDASKIDYSQAVPGNLVEFFRQQTGGSPEFQSILNSLPDLPGAAPSAESMADAHMRRVAQAQALTQLHSGAPADGIDIQQLAYTAPYIEGGLQRSLTEAFGANAEEQAMIADLLARGGDPALIRGAIMSDREMRGQQSGGGGGE